MQICQNPDCSNPFNSDGNKFCISCGSSHFSSLLHNRFQVQKLIGEGGFGRTYLATDTDRLDAACVIKQFLPQVQGTAALNKGAELFKQEAKSLFELGENHTQIPRLLAYFEQGSSMYLVQEFIEGENLLAELEQQTFNEEKIRQLLDDLLPVLQFIHEHHVIHRDIKPENIIRRKDGKLVLIDFGGAKQVTQTSLARQGTGIHTIGYAPTEQIQGFASPGSDLYALGATCVRLLTGCVPVQDDNGVISDTLYNAVNAEWVWREHLPQGVTVSDNLGRILDKLLKHFVKQRYQSAAEVLNDLHPRVFSAALTTLSVPQTQPLQTFSFVTVTVDAQGNITNNRNLEAEYFVEDLGDGVTLEMVNIPEGTFTMGSPAKEKERDRDEGPQHQVTVQSFYMGKYEVTQEQYQAIMGKNPSHFPGKKRPVEKVSWNDAVEFCLRLSQKTGQTYRLPSEAEWEYAARAGTTTPFYFGETITTDLVNYNGNHIYASAPKGKYRQQTTDVGIFPPNAFGLYDMHGNVWEWCQDIWHDNYNGAPSDGSLWQSREKIFSFFSLKQRLLRGGSWDSYPSICRCALRNGDNPNVVLNNVGFRVCAVLI